MKKPASLVLFLGVLILLISSLNSNAQIFGNDTLCKGDTANYYYYPQIGPPHYQYLWSASGGYVNYSSLNTCNITWTSSGGGSVLLTVIDKRDGSTFLTASYAVYVRSVPMPYIRDTVSSNGPTVFEDHTVFCAEFDYQNQYDPKDGDCHAVCTGVNVGYVTDLHQGSTYQWVAIGNAGGSGTVGSPHHNELLWDPLPPYQGSVTVIETDEHGCEGSYTLCIEKIDHPQVDAVISAYSPSPGKYLACVGQEITFTNTSSDDAIAFHWDFGDSTTTTNEHPTHTFDSAGTYYVALTTVNDCGCEDVVHYEFTVQQAISLNIECASTACMNGSGRYKVSYSDPNYQGACTDFSWTVTDGTITSGQSTDEIIVSWGNPSSGYGLVSVRPLNCTSAVCQLPTTIRVPLIGEVDMYGPDTVCINTQSAYSIPPQPGSRFRWTVSGGGTIEGGTLLGGRRRGLEANLTDIVVNWDSPGTYTLSTLHANEPLQCQGSAEKTIVVLDSFYVSGPSSVCRGNQYSYSATNGVVGTWRLLDDDGDLVQAIPSPSAFYISPTAGEYYIEVSDASGLFCNNHFMFPLTIIETPPAPSAIIGDTIICPEIYYQYQAEGAGAAYVTKWKFTNANIDSAFGEQVTVSWIANQSPYQIEVFHLAIDSPYCESPALFKTVLPKPDSIPVITGPDTACVSTINLYQTTKEADDYSWSVIPINAGSIVDQFGAAANIEWHEYPDTVTIRLETKVCDEVTVGTYKVTLKDHPSFSISSAQSEYCVGETASFSLTQLPDMLDTVIWNFGDNSVLTLDTLGYNVSHEFMAPGNYTISAKKFFSGACPGPYTETFNVHINPGPEVRLSAELDPVVCPEDTISASQELKASVYSGVITDYDIEWFKDGVSFQTGSDTYSPGKTEFGRYTITITDTATGCIGTSNFIDLDTCDNNAVPNPPGIQYQKCNSNDPADGNTFSYSLQPQCGEVQFTANMAAGYTTFFHWFFDDNEGYSNGNTHYYPKSGIYHVNMVVLKPTGGGDTCFASVTKPVEVPYYARMNYDLFCFNDSNKMTTIMRSNSDWVTGNEPTIFKFNLTPVHPSQSNPLAMNQPYALSPGTYQVEMEIQKSGSPECHINDSIIVPVLGVADFTVAPGPYCQKVPVHFTNTSTGDIHKYEWDFGDQTQSTMESPLREYGLGTNPPNFSVPRDVSLKVTDIFGCSHTRVQAILVNDHRFWNNFDFNINPDLAPAVCPNDSVRLGVSFPDLSPDPAITASSFLWSTTETTDSIAPKTTGQYWVDVTDNKGCRDIAGLASTGILPEIGARIIGEPEYCLNDVVTLNGFRGTQYSYKWYRDGVQIDTNALLRDRPSSDGTYLYKIEVTDGFCTDSATKEIRIHKLPEVTVGTSPNSCASSEPELTASATGLSPFRYKWSNGEQGSQTTAYTEGMYAVEVTDGRGCKGRTHIDITPMADFKNLMTGCYRFCDDDLPFNLQGMGVDYTDDWVDVDGVSIGSSPLTITSSTPRDLWLHTIHTASSCGVDTSKVFSYQIFSGTDCITMIPRLKPTLSEDEIPEPAYVDFKVITAPNPANNRVTISYQFQAEANNRIVIMDGYNHLVQDYNDLGSTGKLEVNTSELPSGMYFLMITSENVLQFQKLIITH